MARMAKSCLSGHAGVHHDGDDPCSRQYIGDADAKKNTTRDDDKN